MNNMISLPQEVKFIFFGGKGGVGKSTLAAATGLWLADQGFRTLLVSVDFQKSLNDVFNQKITSQETKIEGTKKLWAINTEPGKVIKKHQIKQIKILECLYGKVLQLSFLRDYWKKEPCCETASYNLFVDYLNDKRFKFVVFDTAPGGHSLEMIQWPLRQIGLLLRTIVAKKSHGQEVSFLEKILNENKRAIEMLKSDKTSYVLVSLPDKLPFLETRRMAKDLEKFGIKVSGIIINQVLPEKAQEIDLLKEKFKSQREYLERFRRYFQGMAITQLHWLSQELIGIAALKVIGKYLYGGYQNTGCCFNPACCK